MLKEVNWGGLGMSLGSLLGASIWSCYRHVQLVGGPVEDPERWRDFIYQLAWEHLWVSQWELESFPGERNALITQLSLIPTQRG